MGITSFGIGFCSAYMLRTRERNTDSLHKTYKMVLVVREDLNMSKGKIASQCAHATLLNYKLVFTEKPFELIEWEKKGQTKIVLKTTNEVSLLDLYAEAQKRKLCASIVCDAGRTEVKGGTKTVLAIGPGLDCEIDVVTGSLKTLK